MNEQKMEIRFFTGTPWRFRIRRAYSRLLALADMFEVKVKDSSGAWGTNLNIVFIYSIV